MTEDAYHLLGGVKLLPQHLKDINEQVSDLFQRIPSSSVMLADKSGQNISSNGEIGGKNLVTLDALLDGDFAASQEIARHTGESCNHRLVLGEVDRSHMLISEAGPHLILFIQTRDDVPLDWARMPIHDASRNLEGIIAAPGRHTDPIGMKIDFRNMRDQCSRALEELLQE